MTQAQASSLSTGDKMVLFATSRPSRVHEVTCTDAEFEARFNREVAWAKEIGMEADKAAALNMRTGSPSGSVKVHQADDYYEDVIPPI